MSAKENDRPADTVILRQLPRGPYAPSVSPFPLKLETYLRMTKIPYKNVFGNKMSPKGKTPWIQFNDEVLSDSQFIIEYLNKKYGMDTMKHLTPEERAIARAFQKMVEENLYWTIVRFRWEFDGSTFLKEKMKIPSIILWLIRGKVKKMTYAQGMGRHSKEEVFHIVKGDLQAVSHYLGEKKFLMGEEPCEVDCAIFGMLAQIQWHMPESPHCDIMKELPNLGAYCERMKETFWPDWDQCITHGATKEAEK